MRFQWVIRAAILLLVITGGPSAAQMRLLNNGGKQFVSSDDINKSDWSDVAEMARPWASAVVYIPNGTGGTRKLTTAQLSGWVPKNGKKYPAILWLHGCSGMYPYDLSRAKMFAKQGYVTVALPSFARKKYAKSCHPAAFQGGLYRGVIQMRQYDVGFALDALGRMRAIDPDRIALVGLSEGGILAATFRTKNNRQKVAVRVIEGWTCHAGWPEWAGLNAGKNEKVLSLVAARDPWFIDKPWLQGDCGEYMTLSNGSRSIVYTSGLLATRHALLGFKQPRQDVLNFLKSYLTP